MFPCRPLILWVVYTYIIECVSLACILLSLLQTFNQFKFTLILLNTGYETEKEIQVDNEMYTGKLNE
jgi:hypothetical protein